MIIYEDNELIIPVGLGNNNSDLTQSLQDKDITITENGTTKVIPDNSYIGLSRVTVHTEVPTEINNQEKEISINGITRKTLYPDSGYTGLSSVTVSTNMTLQDKFAKIENTGSTILTADPGYDGLKSVEVYVDVPLKSIILDSSTKKQHIVAVSGGYNDITVNPYTLEEGYFDSSTIAQEYSSSTGGFNKVYINPLTLGTLTVNPARTSQVFEGAYDFVRVNPVTSSIDSNITPENIRKDVTVLGVTGTLEAIGDMQEITVDASTSTQVFTPDTSTYLGYSKVTVNGYTNSFAELYDATTFINPNYRINLTPENLKGLTIVRTSAFATNVTQWADVYYDFTLPSSVTGIQAYPWYRGPYHDINLYSCNITSWPGNDIDGGGSNYANFLRCAINSITFPKKLQTFEPKYGNGRAYVIAQCNISEINLDYCTDLTSVGKLVIDSSVNSISLPSSVRTVHSIAENCQYLTDIYCYATTVPGTYNSDRIIVSNIKTGGTLHVPAGTLDSYANSAWMDASNQYSLAYYGWNVTDDL